MLHIILGILKIAGIIIGVLLLFFLAVFFAVILVPVRYRIQAAKTGGTLKADVRVNWLLHMVSLSVSAGKGKQLSFVLRLFGFRLPVFQNRERKGIKKRSAKEDVEKQAEVWSKGTKEEDAKMVSNPEEDIDFGCGQDQKKDTDFIRNHEQENEIYFGNDQLLKENPDSKWNPSQEEHDEENDEADKKEKPGFGGKLRNIRFKILNICDKIRYLTESIRRVSSSVALLPKRLRRLLMKLNSIQKRPVQFLEMVEEYEIPEIIRKLKEELLRLIKHYGPRHIRGYLDFGTGDPALTGELTGLIYLVLPARADSVEICPDFYAAKLETEFTCTGYIRGIHLMHLLLKFLMDRKMRRLIGKVLKKGD